MVQGYHSFPLLDRVIHWHVHQVPFTSPCVVQVQYNSLLLFYSFIRYLMSILFCSQRIRSQGSLSGLEAGPITSFLLASLVVHPCQQQTCSLFIYIAIQEAGMAAQTRLRWPRRYGLWNGHPPPQIRLRSHRFQRLPTSPRPLPNRKPLGVRSPVSQRSSP